MSAQVSVQEIAERFGVSRSAVSQWRCRHYDFPRPVRLDACLRMWFDLDAVKAWGVAHGRWDGVVDMKLRRNSGGRRGSVAA